jgi:hypothetical protein
LVRRILVSLQFADRFVRSVSQQDRTPANPAQFEMDVEAIERRASAIFDRLHSKSVFKETNRNDCASLHGNRRDSRPFARGKMRGEFKTRLRPSCASCTKTDMS